MTICIAVSAINSHPDRDTARLCSVNCSLKYTGVTFPASTIYQEFSNAVGISCADTPVKWAGQPQTKTTWRKNWNPLF